MFAVQLHFIQTLLVILQCIRHVHIRRLLHFRLPTMSYCMFYGSVTTMPKERRNCVKSATQTDSTRLQGYVWGPEHRSDQV